MRLSEYCNFVVERLGGNFTDFPVVEKFVGQFTPDADKRVSYNCPALYVGLVNAGRSQASVNNFDLQLNFAAVIVLSTLDPNARDVKGWDYAELLASALDTIGMPDTGQTDCPVLGQITKVDKPTSSSNAGYSYWAITFAVNFAHDSDALRDVL